MKNDYVCKYGLYHDKICVDDEPSFNNGWIYTAYAKALGLTTLSTSHYDDLAGKCRTKESYDFVRTRLPGKLTPPISRDEVIGMHYLKAVAFPFFLHNLYAWNLSKKFCWENYSTWQSIKALWSIRNEDRNYMWKNKVYPAYRLAFKILPHDRCYFKSTSPHMKPTLFEWGMFQLYVLTTLLKSNNKTGKVSAKNILWLQLKEMHSFFWIRFIDQRKNFKDYFGEKHIFNRR